MIRVQRTLNTYYSTQLASDNPRSVRTTKYAMKNFSMFLKEQYKITPDEAAKEFADEQIFYDVMQEWINWSSKRISAKAVKLYFQLVKPFFIYKGLKFHPIDLRQNLKFPKVLYHDKHGITREEIKVLLEILKPRKKVLVLCQESSGMRIGELLRLRRKQLDLTMKRICVSIPAEHNKNGRARTTFFSKESAKYLRPIIHNLDDNDLVFTKNEYWESARNTVGANMRRWTAQTGLNEITTHSFRAYFITKANKINVRAAEYFAGHSDFKLGYDRDNTKEDLLKKYLEIEPSLIIEEDERLKIENSLLQKQVSEIESLKAKQAITEGYLRKIVDEMQASMERPSVQYALREMAKQKHS